LKIPEHLLPQESFAGSLNPAFLCADGITLNAPILDGLSCWKQLELGEAERHRLVEASKSPTDLETRIKDAKARALHNDRQALNQHNMQVFRETGETVEPVITEHELKRQKTPQNAPGCKAVVEYRDWQDAWRIRTEVEATGGNQPPEQGDRESTMLSTRGARKIAESCEYMAMKKGGYKTFVTGTFDTEARERINRGETTIQKEVSRTMDAMQKLYQRGFESRGNRVEEHPGEKLAYCWVVEIPRNEDGEENPHVHMLLGWQVPYRHFESWAARIEGIWGKGYFHLEKIHDSNCAGSYMAKAAGYLSKAQGADDQGTVKGNRYGISSEARAPEWVKISEGQLDIMGQLIADVYDHLTVTHGAKYSERKKLNRELEKTPKENKAKRLAIGQRLQKVRESINEIPVRCNKYQVILKGKVAALRFFSWAKTPDVKPAVDWLPEKPEGEYWREGERPKADNSHYFRGVRRKFQAIKHRRHAVTNETCAMIVDQVQEFKDWAFSGWSEYEGAMV
jgi:hypothetical protein